MLDLTTKTKKVDIVGTCSIWFPNLGTKSGYCWDIPDLTPKSGTNIGNCWDMLDLTPKSGTKNRKSGYCKDMLDLTPISGKR